MSSKDHLQAAAAGRLKSVASALDTTKPAFKNPNHLKFAAGTPPGLPVSWTPLNPVQFLLRSAYIRPHRVALKHPAIGVEWTYSEW
jgi:hypothetical protein